MTVKYGACGRQCRSTDWKCSLQNWVSQSKGLDTCDHAIVSALLEEIAAHSIVVKAASCGSKEEIHVARPVSCRSLRRGTRFPGQRSSSTCPTNDFALPLISWHKSCSLRIRLSVIDTVTPCNSCAGNPCAQSGSNPFEISAPRAFLPRQICAEAHPC